MIGESGITKHNYRQWQPGIIFIIYIAIFLKNAWITEDAYINFRSIEQLYAGNGPIWNPGERVQVYTSPLWYILSAILRFLSPDQYLNTIILSTILFTITLFLFFMIFWRTSQQFLMLSMLISSAAFYDFTTSGLENVLLYALTTAMFLVFIRKTDSINDCVRQQQWIAMLFGLAILTRHDSLTLLWPFLAFALWSGFKTQNKSHLLKISIMAFSPLAAFSVFALIYYGFPFPNTAYAKLNTGIDSTELFRQGLNYLEYTYAFDTPTFIIISAGLILPLIPKTPGKMRLLSLGILTNLIYVTKIGGDFMQGRFLSYSCLLSALLVCHTIFTYKYQIAIRYKTLEIRRFLTNQPSNGMVTSGLNSLLKKPAQVLAITILITGIFSSFSPIAASMQIGKQPIINGITNERAFYFNAMSLQQYIKLPAQEFPNSPLRHIGEYIKSSGDSIFTAYNIGIPGYYSGLNKTILDPLALSDPFLARLPAKTPWRIGHFQREIPPEYIRNRQGFPVLFNSDKHQQLYQDITLITRSSDIFSTDRIKKIIEYNTPQNNPQSQQYN